jgi:hypothetical protein
MLFGNGEIHKLLPPYRCRILSRRKVLIKWKFAFALTASPGASRTAFRTNFTLGAQLIASGALSKIWNFAIL